MELFCPWFHPLFTWCLRQSVHNENLIRNLQQSWLILTLSCHRTNLNFMACTFYNAKCVSILRFFCPLFLFLPYNLITWIWTHLSYNDLLPASPLHQIFVYYLHFERETSHFTVLSSFIIVILWLVWNCGNALKETFGRWTWYWKCPFPLSWSYASLTIYPSQCAFMEVLSFALFNNSSPNLQGGVEVLLPLPVQRSVSSNWSDAQSLSVRAKCH